MASAPAGEKIAEARKILHRQLNIPEAVPLLLFNGAFKYSPNREAMENILFRINPLLQNRGLIYQLLIIGLDIPEEIKTGSYPSTSILGFVENLELYLMGSQVFLNPVISGGGIKTKLVEALAYNLDAVSTVNGAIGIDSGLCNGKLMICPNDNWELFAEAVSRAIQIQSDMPDGFYDYFFWGNITKRAADFIG